MIMEPVALVMGLLSALVFITTSLALRGALGRTSEPEPERPPLFDEAMAELNSEVPLPWFELHGKPIPGPGRIFVGPTFTVAEIKNMTIEEYAKARAEVKARQLRERDYGREAYRD